MKRNVPLPFRFFFVLLCLWSLFLPAFAQSIAEGFESGLPASSSASSTNVTLSSGTWNIYNAASSSVAQSGSLALQLSAGSGKAPAYAAAPSVPAVSSVTFWARASGSSKLKVQKSVNGGAYGDIATLNLGTSYASLTVAVNETSADVRIRFANATSATLYIDAVSITGTTTTTSPSVTTSVSSLPDFGSVEVNTTSAEKSYTVSGADLDPVSGNITVTAPTGFEVSASSGTGFASSVLLSYSAGTLASKTVYVRFKPTATQTYAGSITHQGGGATTKSVAVSGTGTSTTSGGGGTGEANAWYVSPTGNDANAGTLEAPFKTITKAVSVAVPGNIIYVRGGNHVYTTPISISKSGTSTSKLYLLAYQNEKPVLDFSSMAVSSSNRGLNLSGSYWEFKGLNFYRAGDNGMYMSGSNNRIELCNFYENFDTGLQLGGGASNNQIINCDSYYNADPNNGNADGFAPKLDVGTNNYFFGCRAWQNSDDGWDGYMRGANDVTTTLENCWVFKSGYLKSGAASAGNGNGFKMGGSDDRTLSHNMILKNCLAFQNKDKGFDQNNNTGSMTIQNSTSFGNARNYVITTALASGKTLSISNSVSAGVGTISLGSFAVQQTNSWMTGFTVTDADFVSVDPAAAFGPRKADGSLPDITFMHLAAGSDLIDRGTNIGLAYNGTAPDLGCFESNYLSSSTTSAVVSVDAEETKLRNAPNPFMGATTLRFSTVSGGKATLRVVNALGQEVATLYDGTTEAGKLYEVELNAGSLPAGMYYGILENGTQRTVHKMVLRK
ncbi:right-handed parallel beta-helix repeat-containing protein [Rufibacter tibetensis]|uniref:right-handed parallel beta-helix repeat-containing protein n=1 Tax=Rufibacter tibetensis TaxID=512763 RepID=UPI000784A3CC|nr:right-handed parallel beta-helix repeat-containing protein [Rufibacter tibetensis]